MAAAPFDYASYFSAPPYNPTATPGASPYSYNVDWSQGNPAYAMKQNRGFMGAWGMGMDQDLAAQQQYAAALENFYRQPMNAAAAQLAQTPGYTPDELANITRFGQYQAGMTTPDQYASLNPTDAETAGITGNTNALYNWFDPSYMEAINQTSANQQRGQFGQAANRMNTALDQQSGAYDSTLGGAENMLQNAWLPSVTNAYGSHEGSINTAVNSPNLQLQLSPQDYLMSGDELQKTVNQAGQAVQNARQSQFEDTYRRAVASGNADPMALAALSRETQGRANEEAANAQTNAYLQARGQQRQLAMNLAQTKLGAGQTQAGMQVGSQENLLQQQMDMARAYEQMNLGLTGERMNAIGAETGARLGTGQYLGTTGIGMEQGIGGTAAGTQQYITGMGTNIASQKEQEDAQRAMQLYQTRLQNAMYGQQSTYNQNTGIQDRQAAAYQAAANARMAGQNQYLNWATGQTGQNAERGLQYGQQRIGAAGTTFGNMNAATGQWGNYDLGRRGQSFAGNFAPSFGRTLGTWAGGGYGSQYGGGG